MAKLLERFMAKRMYHLAWWIIGISLLSCTGVDTAEKDHLFTLVPSDDSGIDFSNDLVFTEEYNPYLFKNFLNGGGVSVGDVNNDGLMDIYFSGNLVPNKLYLNKGDFKFEDITQQAGVACEGVWSSGVTMVDVNGDGLLDIYVCKTGALDRPGRANSLFINKGNLRFEDQASAYGLDFVGLSTHAVFFDYDRDGDLDCYLLNNSVRSVGGYDLDPDQRTKPDTLGGNKLLKNQQVEKGQIYFEDVSAEAGIYSSAIGFGLGVSLGDVNADGWPDLFISNDFFEKDYLYLNNKNGGFSEISETSFQEQSMGSMGADMADLNNDGWSEIFVTEMLPDSLHRYKSKTSFENWEKHKKAVANGYHRQFARNALHWHRGLSPQEGMPFYSEISRYSGVDATEWSWGALIQDFDNDGLKDIYVANGILIDLLDQDYVNFYSPDQIRTLIKEGKEVITTMLAEIPSKPLPNYFFRNLGDFKFENQSIGAGLATPSFSNGSVYADLNNDGRLDLIVNNINEKAFVYKNQGNGGHFLNVSLRGLEPNSHAIGAKLSLHIGQETIMVENFPTRGFQSSVDPRIHFGCGTHTMADSLLILWPNGERSVRYQVDLDKFLLINQVEEKMLPSMLADIQASPSLFEPVTSFSSIPYVENGFSDFDIDRLCPWMRTVGGPHFLDTHSKETLGFLMSSARGSQPMHVISKPNAEPRSIPLKQLPAGAEQNGFVRIDVDGDGTEEIWVLNGGIDIDLASNLQQDVILSSTSPYAPRVFPNIRIPFFNSHTGVAVDLNRDGQKELLIGSNGIPKNFGIPPDLLMYSRQDENFALQSGLSWLKAFGMVQKVLVADVDSDGHEDLIFAMDSGPIRVFINNGTLQPIEKTQNYGLDRYLGFWQTIAPVDLNRDGKMDFVAGNIGENHRLLHRTKGPLYLLTNDFDRNGQIETMYCIETDQGKKTPIHLRDDLISQMPGLKRKVLKYNDYAQADISLLFDEAVLAQSIVRPIQTFQSGAFINEGSKFTFLPFPKEGQISMVRSIQIVWIQDIAHVITMGNHHHFKPELGIQASSYVESFTYQKDHGFRYLPAHRSGICTPDVITNSLQINTPEKSYLLLGHHQSAPRLFQINPKYNVNE